MSFKETIDKIVAKNTEYGSVADIPKFEDVTVESNSSVIMDLTIGKESPSQVSVAQYTDDGTEDPVVMFKYPSFEPMYMRGKLTNTKNEEEINRFLREWGSDLEYQFL